MKLLHKLHLWTVTMENLDKDGNTTGVLKKTVGTTSFSLCLCSQQILETINYLLEDSPQVRIIKSIEYKCSCVLPYGVTVSLIKE